MALLARLTNFTPNTPILSATVNGEFNQLVNALNGVSTGTNLLVRFSSASTAVIAIDQLSSGPIVQFKQGGVELASISNSGNFTTSGTLNSTGAISSSSTITGTRLISTIALGTAPLTVTSTTKVSNLNADQVDGLEGADFVRKSDTSTQTLVSDLTISKTTATLNLNSTTSSRNVRLVNDNTNWSFINDSLGTTPIQMNLTGTSIVTFGVAPRYGSDPSNNDDLSRKSYVDNKLTVFSTSWYYPVVPSATESVESVGRFLCPAGTSITIQQIRIVYGNGSHTSGGTLTWTLKAKNSSGSGLTDIGTITLDNTNNTGNVVYVNDVADYPLSNADQIYPLLTTRSGTITETGVTINIIGYQKLN